MEILTTTSEQIPGKKINKIIGIVRGNTERSKNIARDIGAGLKTLVGGEIKAYTDMLAQARDEAFNRMINNAVELKADAVINIRFMTSGIMGGAAEILCYGTAVKL
jgi:uncharacterized protein YbjQ (UPF0145 family)